MERLPHIVVIDGFFHSENPCLDETDMEIEYPKSMEESDKDNEKDSK